MEKQKIQLNNKLVWASEPYKPNTSIMSSFVGRELEMESGVWFSEFGIPSDFGVWGAALF